MKELNNTLVQAIISKMNWNDMPSEVATAAVKRMVYNRINAICDCCGEPPTGVDSTMHDMIDCIEPDSLWLDLVIDSYQTLNDSELLSDMRNMRGEIEYEMHNGLFFEQAAQEWLK